MKERAMFQPNPTSRSAQEIPPIAVAMPEISPRRLARFAIQRPVSPDLNIYRDAVPGATPIDLAVRERIDLERMNDPKKHQLEGSNREIGATQDQI
jgi:hypothetical protein